MSAVEAAAGKAQAMVRDSVKTVIAASMPPEKMPMLLFVVSLLTILHVHNNK